ncbi:hypothetical protein Bca4012_042901 [Brassica carinata]|uniref:Uncharacterized protein n=1 Tax=Brassica carinata TaxID=52824 RepID=A0A8X7QUF6_BRACI|nr:hypothetical protein Bca52824_059418 [Brassica carinata]
MRPGLEQLAEDFKSVHLHNQTATPEAKHLHQQTEHLLGTYQPQRTETVQKRGLRITA